VRAPPRTQELPIPEQRSHRPPAQLVVAAAATLPGSVLGASAYLGASTEFLTPVLQAVVYGAAIVGGAFLLSWGAEAAQVDISAGLALAVLALLAVLPEYAVDFVFTFQAGQVLAEQGSCVPLDGGPDPCALALANMTGANRVLVGVGWPLVVLVAGWAAVRDRKAAAASPSIPAPGQVELAPSMSIEVAFLGLATLYSLTLPLRSSLTLVDAAVLVTLFGLYAWRLAKAPATEPELIGTSEWIGTQPRTRRRAWVRSVFAFAAVVILLTAEHFAEALVETGGQLGVSEFLLVQWVAPLASESPELIVACLYAWRLKASDSLGTLLSSKVNQWTLLVGTIPIVFALSSTSASGLPLDTNQRLELLITAAQSLFAVALLVDLRLAKRGAVSLLVLFLIQFLSSILLPGAVDRAIIIGLSGVYVLVALLLLLRSGRRTVQLVKDGTIAGHETLVRRDQEQEEGARHPRR
jgi:cation:H+ antiporter